MTGSEFKRAFAIAKSDADLTEVDDSNLFGYGLPDFKPVVATVEAVAKTLRWQAHQFNGQWNDEALTECRNAFRTRVMLAG